MQKVDSAPKQEQESVEERTLSEEESHFIGDLQKAPEFMKDNTNITDGYRINFNTPARIFKSLFMIHNESVNIWSHCLPAIFFIFVLVSFLLVIDADSFRANFAKHREELQQTVHSFHLRLKNASFADSFERYGNEAEQQMAALKHSILTGYQDLLHKVEQESHKMRELIQSNIQNFRDSISADLLKRLREFERSKRRFQREIAPKVVQQFQRTFDGSFVKAFKEHLDELKHHIDSDAFRAMELHEETPNPHHVSKWPIFVFLLSATICLLTSTFFHLFHPMSSKTYGLLLRFDFAGISLLIAGSAFPAFYYSLYCQMDVALIYIAFAFTSAVGCFIICLFEWIHKLENAKYRSLLFGGFGTIMVIPLCHIAINQLMFDNYGDPYEFSSSSIYYVLLLSSYGGGLYIFTVRCPERNNPGRYNICGHSHQIWHFTVVLGIIFTYFAVMENFQMRKVSMCPV